MKLPSWLNPPFWWNWPSLPTELLSGLCCFLLGSGTAALWLLVHGHLHGVSADDFLSLAASHAFGMGAFYELVLDRNGFDWNDLLQRIAGIVAAVLIAAQLSQIF